ncbi:inosine/xanthosine triphosphatase [Caldinitratiruptor microaerophilus]|uniref:Probable inosine/xanthosine triphosphatase n=1 Tax=Caldinitratiruptor microaerophilus TaxID=671077 RepID=A0AA35G8R1_9FIRM|nr:inosine/xanthosine triphosphatase [Caldinitratiruptor microaerophilus]BDG61295.1 NTPase [Caldinitratiruptor microaerophilus]
MKLRIAVGSTNPAKVAATRAVLERAFPQAEVVPVEVPSGVPAQPVGEDETAAGARQRARLALAAVPGAFLGVGLEGGIDREGHLLNCCAIATPDGAVHVAWGVRFPLPPLVVRRVLAGEELGAVMDEVSGIPKSRQTLGAVGILTDGLLTRDAMWQPAIACALAPVLHPELYDPGGRAARPGPRR